MLIVVVCCLLLFASIVVCCVNVRCCLLVAISLGGVCGYLLCWCYFSLFSNSSMSVCRRCSCARFAVVCVLTGCCVLLLVVVCVVGVVCCGCLSLLRAVAICLLLVAAILVA